MPSLTVAKPAKKLFKTRPRRPNTALQHLNVTGYAE